MALTEEGIVHVPGLLSRWVRLPSGARAHYMTAGETGRAVVLLHGGIIGSSGTAGWRFMAPFLGENGFRVFCPDMPAFGLTEDPGDAYGYGDAGRVDFLDDLATALALDRFHIGGNSMGCSDAVNFTVAHPERVISFALIAGGVGDIAPMAERMALDPRPPEERPNITQFDGSEESMRRMLEAIVHRTGSIDDDLVRMRTLAANRHRSANERRMALTIAQNRAEGPANVNQAARLSTKGRFDRLTIPGIYLYGRDDVLIPLQAGYLQEDRLPEIQFFYPADTGHQGQTDQPELFNQVFLEFFRDGRVSSQTARRAGVSDRRPPNPRVVALDA